jgi:hypothetical protein
MHDASPPLVVFLDLGDAFAKALAVGDARRERVRFPSVVASRLLSSGQDGTELCFDATDPLPRPAEFEPERFPRVRSYPRAARFVRQIRQAPPSAGSRFAGELAAIYGADRRLLGHDPSHDAIDALVHKALILLSPSERCEADVVFVVDTGEKAESILAYAQTPIRSASIELHAVGRKAGRQMRLVFRSRVIDAAACIAAALPAELSIDETARVLLIDVGYLRTKLAIVSADGCEQQTELEGLGASALVRKILRDGQEHGLVEDEFAVVQALETADRTTIEVSGRRFSIERLLAGACRELEEELASAAARVLLEHCRLRGETCRAAAIVGGGAAWFGKGLERRLTQAGIGLSRIWVSSDPSFLAVEGARKLAGPASVT